jgi:hypothetical protein
MRSFCTFLCLLHKAAGPSSLVAFIVKAIQFNAWVKEYKKHEASKYIKSNQNYKKNKKQNTYIKSNQNYKKNKKQNTYIRN